MKILSSSKLDKIRDFLTSDWYTVILIVLAAVFIFTGQGVLGTYIFAIIITAAMVLSEDLIPALQGILTVFCFAIRLKNDTSVDSSDSTFDKFFRLWPLAIPVFAFFLARFFIYRKKLKSFGTVKGMAAVSVAVILGGVGKIYWRSYFSATSLFYMCLLGFGMLIIGLYFSAHFDDANGEEFEKRFSKSMCIPIIMLAIALFQEYFSRRAEFLSTMSVIPFQWRNNAATMLMLSMPFAFYFGAKKPQYCLLGFLAFAELILTGSRGGLIFGAVELLICIVMMIVIDRRHRKYYLAAIGVAATAALICIKPLSHLMSFTIKRLLNPDENSVRIELIKRGIEDFKRSPVFGQGIGYMGNRDIHPSAKHALCWYHCSLVQVPASFGIVGIAAYIYLNCTRIRVFVKNLSFFNVILFVSFIGLEMMSLVNPGIFAPFPYLFLVTLYFILMEKTGRDDKSIQELSGDENNEGTVDR